MDIPYTTQWPSGGLRKRRLLYKSIMWIWTVKKKHTVSHHLRSQPLISNQTVLITYYQKQLETISNVNFRSDGYYE